MGELSHAPDGRATRPMGEPATQSLQQGLHTCPTGEPRPDGAASMCSRALQLEHVCRSYERPHKPGGLMRGGGDSTHSVPCQFPGVLSRKHGNVLDGSGWMLGVESFALVKLVRAIVEAHGLVLSTVTTPQQIHERGILI